jgi:hypothetical protein
MGVFSPSGIGGSGGAGLFVFSLTGATLTVNNRVTGGTGGSVLGANAGPSGDGIVCGLNCAITMGPSGSVGGGQLFGFLGSFVNSGAAIRFTGGNNNRLTFPARPLG